MKANRRVYYGGALILLLCSFLFALSSVDSGAKDTTEIKVYVNDEKVTTGGAPVMVEGNTLVPLKGIAEKLGAELTWHAAIKSIVLEKAGVKMEMTINSRTARVNGRSVSLPASPLIIHDRAYVPLRFIAESLGEEVYWDPAARSIYIGKPSPDQLPAVNTRENLNRLVRSSYNDARQADMPVLEAAPTAPPQDEQVAKSEASGAARYSETNIQVQGVDEADIMKTDGKYLYQIRGDTLTISQVDVPDKMHKITDLKFADPNFTPSELFIDKNKLVVIGSSWKRPDAPDDQVFYRDLPESDAAADSVQGVTPDIYPPRGMPPYNRYINITKAIVYDTADKRAIAPVREIEIEGSYLNSRKKEQNIYLIANQQIYDDIIVPQYRDSLTADEPREIPLDRIYYFPGYVYPNFISVIAFDLEGKARETTVKTYLGQGENVYMSPDNLYIAAASYNETAVFKFAVDRLQVRYTGRGIVPGQVLNQFSMDEYREHFRIATTSWGRQQVNNLYVLDRDMKIKGEITGLAPNERIYAARFMGDKAFLVTFEMIDPLFVIDLADPARPAVLGELKIPGFSNYLHPLGERYLLGIGRDTEVIEEKWGPRVVEKGIRLTVFDVSDWKNPQEKYVHMIGESGTQSEVLYNHKALLFDEQSGLLVLPLTVMSSDGSGYGSINKFQGAYVLDVDTERGFVHRGSITHLDKSSDAGNQIRRAFYIGDYLYTLSDNRIKANRIGDLIHAGWLELNP